MIIDSNKIKTIQEFVQLESGRKNINEEAQLLNIDGKSSNNLQTVVSAFDEYFLPLIEKKYVDDDDDDGDDIGDDDNGSRNNNTNTPIYQLLNTFKNFFLNIKLKSATTQDIDNIINPLSLKIHMDVMPSLLIHLK